MNFDDRVDYGADRLRGNKTVDRFFYALTESANHSILWHALNAVVNRNDKRAMAHMAMTLGAESALINGGVKRLFKRSRPVHEAIRPHKLRAPKTTSFPSGHATSAFCAATLLGDGKSRPVKAAWYALAAVVSYSRIHVRLHHASDVIVGAAVGVALGKAALDQKRRNSF